MKMGSRTLSAALLALAASLCAFAGAPPDDAGPRKSPKEIYQALNALRVDAAQVYPVSDLRLRRDAVSLTFSEGTIGFLQAYDGRVTGAVFSGRGHISANLRDPAEKKSLAHFLGIPLLEHGFTDAYLRFDDGSAEELLDQLRRQVGGPASPKSDDVFVETWNKPLPNLNPGQSPRLLFDWVAETPAPYFYAELVDPQWGPFDVLLDNRRSDNVLIGQERWAEGKQYYDVWASYQGVEAPVPPAFAGVSYSINTTIESDHTLDGAATIELRAERAGERGITLELSRFLAVQSVQDAEGRALDFFQNEAVQKKDQLGEQGTDLLLVFLPGQSRAGETYRLRISYRGNVISDSGNGILFVGDRGSWYPHIGGMGQFATYDTTFRWPRRLQLVATGDKVEEHDEGDVRIGRWRSEGPTTIAGFNLGQYKFENMETSDGIKIQVAAGASLENAILDRMRSQPIPGPDASTLSRRHHRHAPITFSEATPTPVAAALKDVGQEIADAIGFEEQWMGPFPYRQLVVSQVPGDMGQGFPGLLYLPSLSFMPVMDQQLVGMSDTSQESLNAVVPFHEVAHQWWGNQVGWDNYRDQWLTEGLSNYIALVGADAEKPGEHLLDHWLEMYRKALTDPAPGKKTSADDAGPLVHGYRLDSSRDPDAYRKVVYGKGMWVFHMLRMMLQDPAAKNPDQRFTRLLQGLLESNRHKALTTEEFQKAVERVMTPSMAVEGGHSMDWFFDQYVRSTGVPAYDVEYSVKPGPKGFRVSGKLIQRNVPDDFILRVPIYGQAQTGKPALLGYVVTSGDETPFQFVSAASPKKLLIDPQITLLCLHPDS
jgi:Peptidase family M1 domain